MDRPPRGGRGRAGPRLPARGQLPLRLVRVTRRARVPNRARRERPCALRRVPALPRAPLPGCGRGRDRRHALGAALGRRLARRGRGRLGGRRADRRGAALVARRGRAFGGRRAVHLPLGRTDAPRREHARKRGVRLGDTGRLRRLASHLRRRGSDARSALLADARRPARIAAAPHPDRLGRDALRPDRRVRGESAGGGGRHAALGRLRHDPRLAHARVDVPEPARAVAECAAFVRERTTAGA